MILGSFDNMLKQLAFDKTQMSNMGYFNVVNDLMAVVGSVQNLAHAVNNDKTNDMLKMNCMRILSELESVISTFGMQRINANTMGGQGMPGMMGPMMPNVPRHNQDFYYPPTMGQQQMYAQQPVSQPQQWQQPMPQPIAQPQTQPHPAVAPTPAPAPAPVMEQEIQAPVTPV